MFIHYHGGGVGRGDSTVVREVTVDPAEVVCESPDARFEFENTDEEIANIYQVCHTVMAFVATTKIRLTGYTFSFILHLQRTLSHHMFLFAMFISHWLALMISFLDM